MIPKNATPEQALLYAQIMQESGGNPQAVSPKGAAGIMQIMPDTARDPGYGVQPLQGWDGIDPRTASVDEQIRFGNDYRNALTKKFSSVDLGLAAYNAGAGNVQKYGGIPPFKETQNYVASIKGNMNASGGGVQVADNGNNWRSRAKPVMTEAAPAASDWRSRAKPVQAVVTANANQEAPPAVIYENQMPQMPANAVSGDVKQPQFNKLQSGIAGLAQGASANFGDEIIAGLTAPVKYAGIQGLNAVGVDTKGLEKQSIGQMYDQERTATQAGNEQAAADNPVSYGAGYVGGAVGTGVAGAGTKAGAAVANSVSRGLLPQAISGAGKTANFVTKMLQAGAVGGASSSLAAAGAANSGGRAEAAKDAFTGGALVGAAIPVAGAAINSVIKPKISKDVAALAKRATDDFGIKLSLDQVAPSRVRDTIQKVSQSLPGSGVDAFQEAQKNQWMKAVAKELGEDADNLAPEVVQNFLKNNGAKFEGALAKKTLTITQKDVNSIADIAKQSKSLISANLADVVQNNVDDFIKNLGKFQVGKPRVVAGEKLASLRSQMLKKLPNVEGGARQQVAQIIDKLDDVITRHLSPDEVKSLQTARQQWRNYKTLEPLLEKSADGTINPTQLMQRVASSKYIKASRKGLGDDNLVDLARIGKQFMARKGGSDTTQKLIYAGAGANAASLYLSPQTAVPLMLLQGGAMAANKGYQSLINQAPSIVNRAIKGVPMVTPKAMPVAAMLTGSATHRIPQNP